MKCGNIDVVGSRELTRRAVLVLVGSCPERTLLFVSCQDLARAGYNSLSLHGGKDQTDRDFTIADFKNKSTTLMVATSVAGRCARVRSFLCRVSILLVRCQPLVATGPPCVLALICSIDTSIDEPF